MSIATRTGDDGTTALAFGRRVAKNHPRVKAYGAVDEFSSALGLARAFAQKPSHKETILRIQKDLLRIMAILAVDDADRGKMGARYNPIADADVAYLDNLVKELEKTTPPFTGWVLPGDDPASAHLHHARTVCRRAEREIAAVAETGQKVDAPLLQYVNRLSDLCWLLARETA
jgi:cob(I)alamin adenosyltransferase